MAEAIVWLILSARYAKWQCPALNINSTKFSAFVTEGIDLQLLLYYVCQKYNGNTN